MPTQEIIQRLQTSQLCQDSRQCELDINQFDFSESNNISTDQELAATTKRQLSITSQINNSQEKEKILKIVEEQHYQAEPEELQTQIEIPPKSSLDYILN